MIRKKENLVVFGIFIVIFALYIINITYSGLWYDEAVEYFYSKFTIGEVPGGFGTQTMYERICETFQPPLYNVLMHIWLSIYDSEWWFRLAGVLTTLAGAPAIYKILKSETDYCWASIGVILYLLSSSITYYALECSEYNLMLCFNAWMIYFYVRTIRMSGLFSLIGFFVFSCMSVYSQYGAAFLVVGLYISLIIVFLKRHDRKSLKNISIVTVLVIVLAVVPLVCFFLVPQMKHQGSIGVSHFPVFVKNILYDYLSGGFAILTFVFTAFGTNKLMNVVLLGIVCIAGIFVFVSLIKEKKVLLFVIPLLITYTIYFVSVACSFYAYNYWTNSFGCYNLGGRYALFFAPLIIVMLVIGIYSVLQDFKSRGNRKYKVVVFLILMGGLLFGGSEIVKIIASPWRKDDIREVTAAWYENDAYNGRTLVHQWDDAMFQFYLIHNKDYDEEFQEKIEAADIWIRTADEVEMSRKLVEMGYLDLDAFYYISPIGNYSESYIAFLNVMRANGYSVMELYAGNSCLLYVSK